MTSLQIFNVKVARSPPLYTRFATTAHCQLRFATTSTTKPEYRKGRFSEERYQGLPEPDNWDCTEISTSLRKIWRR